MITSILTILLLVVWVFGTFTVYQLLKLQQGKWAELGLLVPWYSKTERYYGGKREAINEPRCFFYAACWLFTIPFTAFHYYCIIPFVEFLTSLGVDENDQD